MQVAVKKILVVDDQRAQQCLMRELLEKLQYAVTTLDSAEEALYLLETVDIPVIITDLKMPWMDGAQFCRQVKTTRLQTAVFLLSGYIDLYDQDQLQSAGFDAIFKKPVKTVHLEKALAEAFCNYAANGKDASV